MRLFLILPLFVLLIAGCGPDGPKIVTCKGKALHKGEPMPSLLIQFQPKKGRPSWAITNAKGEFEMEYDEKTKGVVAGEHTVTAIFRAGSPEEEGRPLKASYKFIQEKYGDVTKGALKIEVMKNEDALELKFD